MATSSIEGSFGLTLTSENLNFVDEDITILNEKQTVSYSSYIKDSDQKKDKGDRGQDYTRRGKGVKYGKDFTYFALFDGHGTDTCVDSIRNLVDEEMSIIMSAENPVIEMANYITKNNLIKIGDSSGSTMVVILLFNNFLECHHCGDSEAVIFIDDELKYRTLSHDSSNINERSRISTLNGPFGYKGNPMFMTGVHITIVSDEEIHDISKERILFPPIVKGDVVSAINPTQALGHHSKTKYTETKQIIEFNENSKVKFIIGSDGMWDMIINGNENEMKFLKDSDGLTILNKIYKRWKKKWNYKQSPLSIFKKNPKEPIPHPYSTNFSGIHLADMDDISITVVEIVYDSKSENNSKKRKRIEEKTDGVKSKKRSTKRKSKKRLSSKRKKPKRLSSKRK